MRDYGDECECAQCRFAAAMEVLERIGPMRLGDMTADDFRLHNAATLAAIDAMLDICGSRQSDPPDDLDRLIDENLWDLI